MRDLAKQAGRHQAGHHPGAGHHGQVSNCVSRRRDEKDRRNVLVQRTVKGALYLERLADTIGNLARKL